MSLEGGVAHANLISRLNFFELNQDAAAFRPGRPFVVSHAGGRRRPEVHEWRRAKSSIDMLCAEFALYPVVRLRPPRRRAPK